MEHGYVSVREIEKLCKTDKIYVAVTGGKSSKLYESLSDRKHVEHLV